MSDEEQPELPPIEQLSVKQAHRIICADYLRALAKLITEGQCEAFDIMWTPDYPKPVGKMTMQASSLHPPMETKIEKMIADFKIEQMKKIPVVDVTEQLKEHEPCQGEAKEHCHLCNDKLS